MVDLELLVQIEPLEAGRIDLFLASELIASELIDLTAEDFDDHRGADALHTVR